MKFQDKFKPSDIICSDYFHNGLCMVVESGGIHNGWGDDRFRYKCQDLIRENQGWCAYEIEPLWEVSYNWRIATDDDIVNYISRFVNIKLGKVGIFEIKLTDDGITLDDGVDYDIYLDAEELVQLSKIINERVVT